MRCPHCGTPVEGDEASFCCAGCELAFAIIRGAGLEHYYQERTAYSPRPAPLSTNWNAVPVVHRATGSCEARLVIDDIRCASCVWLIERVLERAPGVEAASVSYATGRTSLRWRAGDTNLDELAQTIARLGYRPRALGEESKPDRTLLVRLGIAAFAAMNLMLMAASIYAGWLNGMDERYATLLRWVSLVLATPIALWCAAPFFTGAIVALKNRMLHFTLTTRSHSQGSPSTAPAFRYSSSEKPTPRPAPGSTTTFDRPLIPAGDRATRCSPSFTSRGMPIRIRRRAWGRDR